jgi:hypothetical protein
MGQFTPPFPFSTALPEAAFDDLITWAGINVLWMKSHACPCAGDTGSAQPQPLCNACFGRGFYWDPPQGPFIVLITFISWIGRNVAIGEEIDPAYGMTFEAGPILTIQNTTANSVIWQQANTNDIFIEMQAQMRFQSTLRVGQNMTIPQWQILGQPNTSFSIPPSGAVVVENPTLMQPVQTGISYTVNGGTVTLNPDGYFPQGYPVGTSYTVEYFSQPTYVIQEKFGGLMHSRPFGQGITYPHRYKIQMLDLWLRDKAGLSTQVL